MPSGNRGAPSGSEGDAVLPSCLLELLSSRSAAKRKLDTSF